ncbi:MFS transporter [Nocardia sp. NBC_00416]|uniref:MFS transporter n=1 Tax=Nocardia sp. NBC_00416 TaxID=2975991 RepID=UPI002E229E0F
MPVIPEAAGPRHRRAPGSANAFRALRSRPFRWYFAGQIASASGTFLQATAIGRLVLQLTGSPASLGTVLAAGGLPQLLFGPWGGMIADRVDLRRLLIGTQIGNGLLAAALWLTAVTGHAGVPSIVAISVAGGLVQILDAPARQTFVAQLVPAADLASAASVNGVVMNSARVVGPVLAGLLIASVGTVPCSFGIALAATAVAPNLITACAALSATGGAAFCFVTLASTALQLHSDPAYRGRVMALWVFVFLGTTPIGSLVTGWIINLAGPRAALLVGAAACLAAASLAARVHTPPHPDAVLRKR